MKKVFDEAAYKLPFQQFHIMCDSVGLNLDDNGEKRRGRILYDSVIFDRVDIIKYLVSKNVGVNIRMDDGTFPIHAAVMKKNLEMVKYLQSVGADLNAVNRKKTSCLYMAIVVGDMKIIKFLIECGARFSNHEKLMERFFGTISELIKDVGLIELRKEVRGFL